MEQKYVQEFESVWLQEHRETPVLAVKQEQDPRLSLDGGVKTEPLSSLPSDVTTELYSEKAVCSEPGTSKVKTELVSDEDIPQTCFNTAACNSIGLPLASPCDVYIQILKKYFLRDGKWKEQACIEPAKKELYDLPKTVEEE